MDEPSSLPSRKVAPSAITLHVGPGESIQAAVNELMWQWDMRGRRASIKVADGVYTEHVNVRGLPLGGTSRPAIVIQGNTVNPSACVLDVEQGPAFENWGGHVAITGFRLSTKRRACIFAHDSGTTLIGAVEFGESIGEHILAAGGHTVRHKSDYIISGGAPIHAHVVDGATYGNGRTVTLVGTPHFRDEFHGLNYAKSMWTGTRFMGSATGVRHIIHFNSVCAIGGADAATFFPGDRPGVISDFSTMA